MLEQATIAHPGNKALLAAYGRALADNGNSQAAFDVLSRAHSPDNPDWRILSVQGTTLDKLGRHEEARRYYASALKIVPEEPSVLSNLGLSYMLTRELPKAEETLRRAYANPRADARVRQNLALVVGLQGRFAEAETIVKADLPADEAAANVAYLQADAEPQGQPARRHDRAGGGAQPAGLSSTVTTRSSRRRSRESGAIQYPEPFEAYPRCRGVLARPVKPDADDYSPGSWIAAGLPVPACRGPGEAAVRAPSVERRASARRRLTASPRP